MKLTVYDIGLRMKTFWAHVLTMTVCGVIAAILALHFGFWSSEKNSLYQANVQANTEFVQAVESDWPGDRALVFTKLLRLQTTYLNTGEYDPAKLGEYDRLQNWLASAVSVADEQQFLAEVRSNNGRLVMGRTLSTTREVFFCLILAFCILGFFAHLKLLSRLEAMEPRLRPPSVC